MQVTNYTQTDYTASVIRNARNRITTLVASADAQPGFNATDNETSSLPILKVDVTFKLGWTQHATSTEMEAEVMPHIITQEIFLDLDCPTLEDKIVSRFLKKI